VKRETQRSGGCRHRCLSIMPRRKVPEEIKKFWRLFGLPIDAVWQVLNEPVRSEAPECVLETLMYSLRHGPDALGHADTLQRLSQISERQLIEVATRLQTFRPEIAPAWTVEQLKILIAVRGKL